MGKQMPDTANTDISVLLVDDEPHILSLFSLEIRSAGLTVEGIQESSQVMPFLSDRKVEVVVLDLSMPQPSGEELLESISIVHPEVPVIVVTGIDEVDTAVRCMKKGAFDYITKPVEDGRLSGTVKRALSFGDLRKEIASLKQGMLSHKLVKPEAFSDIVTRDQGMLSIFKYIEAIGKSSEPVLITGETGVGKDLIANSIHKVSGRKGKLVKVNVAGLDDSVFTDTLFGHVEGAFTGAVQTREGLIRKASGGTLFLDEIGDLSLNSQIKLLGLIQEREYLPLGQDEAIRTDARIMVATNQNLEELIGEKRFRKDLFYRFQTHHVQLPPLRKRLFDLPLLVGHFVSIAAQSQGKREPRIALNVFESFAAYDFPGNIRELEAIIFDAVSTNSTPLLEKKHFNINISAQGRNHAAARSGESMNNGSRIVYPLALPTIKEATSQLIDEALSRTKGNISQASLQLGISQPALSKRLKKK
jgi:DNA-binding NtrC family response regulator